VEFIVIIYFTLRSSFSVSSRPPRGRGGGFDHQPNVTKRFFGVSGVRIGVPPLVHGRPDRNTFCVSERFYVRYSPDVHGWGGGLQLLPNGRCWKGGGGVQKICFC